MIDRLDLQQYRASIVILHETYHDTLDSGLNQMKYADYWKTNGSWDALGVIESYMNPNFDLFKELEDFCILLERVGLLRLSQADTERVFKTIRRVEPRFAGFNEVKQSKGAAWSCVVKLFEKIKSPPQAPLGFGEEDFLK